MAENQEPIRVFLVDDHALFRASLRALLRGEKGMEMVGEAANMEDAVEGIKRSQPDVVLMDISLGKSPIDGLDGTRMVRSVSPDVPVLVLTMHEDDELLLQAAHAGACGYLLKDSSREELVDAIRATAGGGGWISPLMARRAMRLISGTPASVPDPTVTEKAARRFGLSERELEVLRLMARGHTYQEIAEALYASVSHVKQVASSLCDKLGARDKAHATAIAVAEGLVPPPRPGGSQDAQTAS